MSGPLLMLTKGFLLW